MIVIHRTHRVAEQKRDGGKCPDFTITLVKYYRHI